MPQPTLQHLMSTAIQHHQAGRLHEAERLYRQILAREPNHADATHHLAIVAFLTGRNGIAGELIRRALVLNPNNAESHNVFGSILRQRGQLDEAIAVWRKAISLRPDFPGALSNLGSGLKDKGEMNEAIALLRRAVALDPRFFKAHNNLGNALTAAGQLDEAIAAYRQAIAIDPSNAPVHGNLGIPLMETGRLDEAIAAFRQAIALKRDFPQAHVNLGNALRAKGELDEAIASYRQAISLKPDYAQALSNLGNVLMDKGQVDEAIAAFSQAIALRGDLAELFNNLAVAYSRKGQFDKSLAACRRATALKPAFPHAHTNLGNALRDMEQLDEAVSAYHEAIAVDPNFPESYLNLGNVLKDMGQIDQAIAAYRKTIALDPNCQVAHSNVLYSLHFLPRSTAQSIAEEHRAWNRELVSRLVSPESPTSGQIQPHRNDRDPNRRLRIGYVSPDFQEHPVGRFLVPLVSHHDKSRVEVFAYSQVTGPDAMTQRLRSCVDSWRNIVGLSDSQVAGLIRQDRIDILVDLSMHMAHNRMGVFARRPAPVQVTYLAYCSTTGLETLDYRLSDPYLDPPGADESVYSEKTIRLPDTYWCYQPHLALAEEAGGTAPASEAGHITFGSLNNFCKVNEAALSVWARLLRNVPRSVLLLHVREGSHRQRVLDLFQQEGIARDRVRFAPFMPTEQYLALYRQIDIALDTFPYGGGTTTCDALWMGVPVVSLAGQTAVGRGGLSILSNVGLAELVAHDLETYVQIATDLAGDLSRLGDLRRTLRKRMTASPLMDAPRFAGNVEAIYRSIWTDWCAGRRRHE